MRVANILLIVASSLGALAQVPDHFNKRAACNRDNLFRCFIDQRYSSQASDFCAELAPFTVTVATSIATVTSTVESTITADAAEVTEIHKTTVFTATVPTATTVVTADAAGAVKRQVAANPPKCMTNGVTYPASRIRSACSCISVPASTVSVTHVVSTETITEINTIITTPRATVTSWETVFTATTGGTSTITVLPTKVNRLINGDFETGDSTGWRLSPDSWKGDFYKLGTPQNQWMYSVYDAAGELGILRQVKPVYLEAGSYQIGLHAPPTRFPLITAYWTQVVRYELVNHATQTTINPKFGGTKVVAAAGTIVVPLQASFEVPETAEGYYVIALRFLERPPEGQLKGSFSKIDNLYLQKL